MNINCNNTDGQCSQCGKPAVAWVRTCRAVVTLPTERKAAATNPVPKQTPQRFADIPPCRFRGDSRSVKDGCTTCVDRYVQVAYCSILGCLCSVNGSALNGSPTAKCLGCLYNPTLGSDARG